MKKYALALIVFFGLAAFLFKPVAQAQQAPVAQRWEYKTIDAGGQAANWSRELSAAGRDGWELAASVSPTGVESVLIFKRPIR